MTAHEAFAQDVAVLARQFPNVYTSGYWWHTFFPTLIERAIGMRVQIARSQLNAVADLPEVAAGIQPHLQRMVAAALAFALSRR